MPVISYVAYMCAHDPHLQVKYMAHEQFGSIFVSDTYITIACKAGVVVGLVWHIYAKLLVLYGHTA